MGPVYDKELFGKKRTTSVPIRYHGNYVGPGWSAGKFQDSVAHSAVQPIDDFDATAMEHDRAYALGHNLKDADYKFYKANFGKGPKRTAAAIAVGVQGYFRPDKNIEMTGVSDLPSPKSEPRDVIEKRARSVSLGKKKMKVAKRSKKGSVRRSGRTGRKLLRIKKRRSTKRSRKGRSRRSKGIPGLSGGRAIIGGRDEEDPQVKRHAKYGVVIENGSSGTVQDTNGGWLVQSSVPQVILLQSVFLSLVKQAFNQIGLTVKDFTIGAPVHNLFNAYVSPPTEYTYLLNYLRIDGGYQNIVYTSTISSDTLLFVAEQLMGQLTALGADTGLNLQKFKHFNIFVGGQGEGSAFLNGQPLSSLDMDGVYFNIDSVSNLVYQNRSQSDDSSTSALDVDQQPLFEVVVDGSGCGPVYVNDNNAVTYRLNTDYATGVYKKVFGGNKNLIAEPSKSSFNNAQRCMDTISNPGVVKQSKLKSHYRMKMDNIFMKIRIFEAINNGRSDIGKYRGHWFRKTISLADGNGMTVAYQHHFAIGVTCNYKRISRSLPVVRDLI